MLDFANATMHQGDSPLVDHAALAADEKAAAGARSRLAATGYDEVRNVGCSVLAGVMTLYGTVTLFYHKQVAQEVVRHVPGIRAIINRVVVESNELIKPAFAADCGVHPATGRLLKGCETC